MFAFNYLLPEKKKEKRKITERLNLEAKLFLHEKYVHRSQVRVKINQSWFMLQFFQNAPP